jgi:hypothetical protein
MKRIKNFILFNTDLCEVIVYLIIIATLIVYYQTLE